MTDLLARLMEGLAKLQEGGRRLPWELWTSCSYRRIKTAAVAGDLDHGGKDVLSGYRCDDGVVDLSMPEDQLFALVELVNALPDLLAMAGEIEGLRAALGEACELIPHCDGATAVRLRTALTAPSMKENEDGR